MNVSELKIVKTADNHYTVFCGEDYSDDMTWGEMIDQVISLTHPEISRERFTMATPEFYQARRERRNSPQYAMCAEVQP